MDPATVSLVSKIVKKVLPIIIGCMAVMFVLILALCLMVTGDANASANAQTCSSALQPVASAAAAPQGSPAAVIVPIQPQGPQNHPTWNASQVQNAATITNTARSLNLPPRAAVIAVATAMQESSLNNLKGGDRDSLGLFQQRPSQGWGTATELADPIKASEAFYAALTKVANWQTIPLTDAAQDVQHSGFPQAYAPWEQSAGALVSQTWGNTAVTSEYTGCDSNGADPTAEWHLTHTNPRTAAQAIAAARYAGAGNWQESRVGYCDNFVAQAYGWFMSGSDDAATQWSRLVALGEAHPGDNSPPPGALLFYRDNNVHGHVDLYLGGNEVASTDVTGPAKIGIVTREAILHWLGPNTYLGWAAPDFPSAGGTSTLPLPGSAT